MSLLRNGIIVLAVCLCTTTVWGDPPQEKPLAEAIYQEGGSVFCLRTPRLSELASVEKDGAFLVGFHAADICRIDVATGTVSVLTKKPLPVGEISPAPDGHAVAFLSKGDKASDVFVLDCQTGSVANLTKGAGNALLPAWSPDGKQIAFASDRAGDWRVFVMGPDGAGVKQVGDWNAKNVLQNLAIPPDAALWEIPSLRWMSDSQRLLIQLDVGTAKEPLVRKGVGRVLTVGKGGMQEWPEPPWRSVPSHDDKWFVSSDFGPTRQRRNPPGADLRTTALFVSEIGDGAKKRLVYDGGPIVWCSSPAWSPSDEMIVFEWAEEHASLQRFLKYGGPGFIEEVALAVVSIRSGGFERLTEVSEYDWREPHWVRKAP